MLLYIITVPPHPPTPLCATFGILVSRPGIEPDPYNESAELCNITDKATEKVSVPYSGLEKPV